MSTPGGRARVALDHAALALGKWNTNPENIPLPDVVNTRRPKLTREQMVARYMKSIEGNPSVDIKKIEQQPKMTQRDASKRSTAEPSQLNQTVQIHKSWTAVDCNNLPHHLLIDPARNLCDFFSYEGPMMDNFGYKLGTDVLLHTIGVDIATNPEYRATIMESNFANEIIKRISSNGYFLSLSFDKNKIAIVDDKAGVATVDKPNLYKSYAGDYSSGRAYASTIDDLIENNGKSEGGCLIFAPAEAIDAWGAQSRLLNESKVFAVSARSTTWAKAKFWTLVAGSAVGFAAIVTCVLKARKIAASCLALTDRTSIPQNIDPSESDDQHATEQIEATNQFELTLTPENQNQESVEDQMPQKSDITVSSASTSMSSSES